MTASKPTLRCVTFYFAVFIVVLLGFYVIPSGWMEALAAQAAADALSLFGHSVVWAQEEGGTTLTLVGQRTVIVSIIRECTALNVFGVMTGLILPLKASSLRRATGIIFSGLILFALNIPRIALTVYLTAFDTWPFVMIADRSLDTYHYPISFAFGVVGVAITVLAVNRWTTPELGDTLLGFVDAVGKIAKRET